jgi:hypothetical protein
LSRIQQTLSHLLLLLLLLLFQNTQQATHLIKYLQSMKGRRLWSYEDLALGQQQQLHSATALSGTTTCE